MKKKNKLLLLLTAVILCAACSQQPEGHRTVLCIPVYGQSLALGEEAERKTNFDSLAAYADGRIVTENLDHRFGYFENNGLKKLVKKLADYQKRAYELSVYRMAERLADQTGPDTLICIFPGGQGATAIANLSKGTPPYAAFMDDIRTACDEAASRGWTFLVPAVCWMQGESDIADYPTTDYRQLLAQIRQDMDADIRAITRQQDSVRFVCYQANALTRAEHFRADSFECRETAVPMAFVELLHKDSLFWASGPTYPYACVGEKIHIDANGQQAIGLLAARSVLGIVRGQQRFRGLVPLTATVDGKDVVVSLSIPTPPLTLDTIQVSKADNYGFSVVTPRSRNIATAVTLSDSTVRIHCSEPLQGCKVRYAVNGDYMKSGNQHGPRGNLRDAAGNWCYQFDLPTDTKDLSKEK